MRSSQEPGSSLRLHATIRQPAARSTLRQAGSRKVCWIHPVTAATKGQYYTVYGAFRNRVSERYYLQDLCTVLVSNLAEAQCNLLSRLMKLTSCPKNFI